jgi:hypothetical protein
MKAAASVALRMINEASEAIKAVPANRYVHGLESIATHVAAMVTRFA